MPIGWSTVLGLVPWGEVIKNAPAVAEAAKKLWDNAGRKAPPPPEAGGEVAAPAPPQTDAAALAALQARLARSEAEVAQLQAQMQASSELTKALAEQNSELIRRVEVNRVRLLWLAGLVLVFVAIAGLNLVVTFSR